VAALKRVRTRLLMEQLVPFAMGEIAEGDQTQTDSVKAKTSRNKPPPQPLILGLGAFAGLGQQRRAATRGQ
jgi:hypothetical protein